MTHPFGNRRGALFLSGSEPLGAGRCPPACYDVDSRVADPVKLFSVASLARLSADGKKAHPAGDTAIKQLHGPTSQPSAALLAKESQDVSAIRKQRGDDAPSGAGGLRCSAAGDAVKKPPRGSASQPYAALLAKQGRDI